MIWLKVAKVMCDVCGGHFKDKDGHRVHMRTRYTKAEERPFCCDVCGAGFKTKESLIVHVSSHTKEWSFNCDACGFQTKNQGLFKAHIKSHRGNSPVCHGIGSVEGRFSRFLGPLPRLERQLTVRGGAEEWDVCSRGRLGNVVPPKPTPGGGICFNGDVLKQMTEWIN